MDEERRAKVAFLAGAVTGWGLVGILLGFATWRVGAQPALGIARTVVLGPNTTDDRLPPVPGGLLPELIHLGAVFDNAENLTGARDHENLLVQPDERRIYKLRPNARVDAFMLATRRPLNLDPPVLYLPSGRPRSAALEDFLRENTRLRYSFNVDARGFRRTLPSVQSRSRILMVGDSVLFGVGINDEDTMASALQSLLGDTAQVVNAGVGEYGPEEIYRTAEELTAAERFDALVYIACQNDFEASSGEDSLSRARRMLESLSALAPRFGFGLVVLQTAMEYTTFDVLREAGWTAEQNAATDHLRAGLPSHARRLGFGYVDWAELLARSPQQHGTLFHRFGFYVDHYHLSPLGNRLVAGEVFRALAERGVGRH